MSHYDDLGIATNATDEEIKRAYRDKAVLTHPDKGGDAAEFAKIARAYETLKDPDRRRLYDETGKDERLPFDLAVRDTILQGFSWALDTLGSDADIVEAVRGRLSEWTAPATPRWSSGQTFKIDLTGWRI